MQIETFELQEVTDQGVEQSAEAVAICEKLGLSGQLERGKDASGTRFSYRKMTALEGRVYGVLCPRKTEIAKYSDEPIPLRVLQVAAHGREMFDTLEIWHPDNADIKDPVLVGIKDPVLVGIKGTSWSGERYILARWGEVLDSLDVLKSMAAKIVRSKIADKLAEADQKLQSDKVLSLTLSDDAVLESESRGYGYNSLRNGY